MRTWERFQRDCRFLLTSDEVELDIEWFWVCVSERNVDNHARLRVVVLNVREAGTLVRNLSFCAAQ
jgi:hypothetical protein